MGELFYDWSCRNYIKELLFYNLSQSSWAALFIQGIFFFSLLFILILLSKLEVSSVITLINFNLFILILICEGYLPATSISMGCPADFQVTYPQVDGLRIWGLFCNYIVWNLSIISTISGAGPLQSFVVTVQRPYLFIQMLSR